MLSQHFDIVGKFHLSGKDFTVYARWFFPTVFYVFEVIHLLLEPSYVCSHPCREFFLVVFFFHQVCSLV